jgi:hypothetical protein
MKILIAPVLVVIITLSVTGCKSSSSDTPATFCDTSCLKDSINFSGDFKLKPYVYISAKDCRADSITWSYKGMGINRKTGFTYLLNNTVLLNKDNIRCVFNDTSYAWLLFNDCATGRGYQLRLPFNKTADIGRKSSGINNIDKKFSIADNLVVNTDRGNIFVEDMITGKKAMMTFGQKLDIDYDAVHEFIDSVNITNSRIWVKILVDKKWVEKEKNITLE